MLHALRYLSFALSSVFLCLGVPVVADEPVWSAGTVPNANHIFNSIHSATRIWGSSLNHNGMTAFIATVAADTELYFGGDSAEPVNGTEWLAFEPELSSWSVKAPGDSATERIRVRSRPWKKQSIQCQDQQQVPWQKPLLRQPQEDDAVQYGYLHTYRTKHQLRLLYLDGLAASLSKLGTSDLQDRILLHGEAPGVTASVSRNGTRSSAADQGHYIGGQPDIDDLLRIDYARADRLCSLAQTTWRGRIDGFLRSQWTSEIILCNFAKHLTLARATRAPQLPYRDHDDALENWVEYRAVASQFDGIGGNRVRVDFDRFVSLYALPDAVEWDRRGLPRANNSTLVVRKAQEAVAHMILSSFPVRPSSDRGTGASGLGVDWQAVTDQIVIRYSDAIARLTTSPFDHTSNNSITLSALRTELDILLRPFIDFLPSGIGHGARTSREDLEEKEAVIERCAWQFIARTSFNLSSSSRFSTSSLAAAAILNVTTTLCNSLVAAHGTIAAFSGQDGVAENDIIELVQERLRRLRTWLAWTAWKRCRGCDANAVCFAPMFPFGGFEDYARPRCRESLIGVGTEYWEADVERNRSSW